jgi:hypothetical protein
MSAFQRPHELPAPQPSSVKIIPQVGGAVRLLKVAVGASMCHHSVAVHCVVWPHSTHGVAVCTAISATTPAVCTAISAQTRLAASTLQPLSGLN